jgi:hypothetical protein
MNRKQRRAAARKEARKAGLPRTPSAVAQTTTTTPTFAPEPVGVEAIVSEPHAELNIPEPGYPFPSLKEISPARFAANRANAEHSTGPTSSTGRQISAQNHTLHGLARHRKANFKLLTSESADEYQTFVQALIDEHTPATETESILVSAIAESHWLAQRAQRLQDTCINPDTGVITDDKKFSLYMRYQTTHTRGFHKCLNDLLKLRAENRKTELGFEAQRIQSEKLEMKKQHHYWDVLKKDGEACHQISINTLQFLKARNEVPGFEAQYTAELEKFGLNRHPSRVGEAA